MLMNIVETWSVHRRRVRHAKLVDFLSELHAAEDSLTNALSFGSQKYVSIARTDRTALVELIDEIRNYIDHIKQEYEL